MTYGSGDTTLAGRVGDCRAHEAFETCAPCFVTAQGGGVLARVCSPSRRLRSTPSGLSLEMYKVLVRPYGVEEWHMSLLPVLGGFAQPGWRQRDLSQCV